MQNCFTQFSNKFLLLVIDEEWCFEISVRPKNKLAFVKCCEVKRRRRKKKYLWDAVFESKPEQPGSILTFISLRQGEKFQDSIFREKSDS